MRAILFSDTANILWSRKDSNLMIKYSGYFRKVFKEGRLVGVSRSRCLYFLVQFHLIRICLAAIVEWMSVSHVEPFSHLPLWVKDLIHC